MSREVKILEDGLHDKIISEQGEVSDLSENEWE